mmetsp:Transcript_21614/g.28930  ORF Transcript_21614/g.28930 Transcript_21614/m.28930 type:complete len:123 (+) Transcript_21614:1405-1773(+)
MFNPTQWRADSMLAQLKPRLFLFFQASFRLAARDILWPQVRLYDLAKLYTQILTPWTPYSQFLQNCLKMEQILTNEGDVSADRSMFFSKGKAETQDRLKKDVFKWLTHNSVPMTNIKEEEED